MEFLKNDKPESKSQSKVEATKRKSGILDSGLSYVLHLQAATHPNS